MPTPQCHYACRFFVLFVICDVVDCKVKLFNDMDSLEFQADVETDEVYSQMTLQPLTPVILSSLFLHWVLIKMLELIFKVSKNFLFLSLYM